MELTKSDYFNRSCLNLVLLGRKNHTDRLAGWFSGIRTLQTDGFRVEFNLSRGVAQSGSASALGAECREFESLHPDQEFFFTVSLDIHLPVAQSDRASAF